MRYTPVIVDKAVARASGRKKTFLVLLFDALYSARQREAERTLRRYHHAIAHAQLRIRRELSAP